MAQWDRSWGNPTPRQDAMAPLGGTDARMTPGDVDFKWRLARGDFGRG